MFLISLFSFLFLLPPILLFTFGYKIDWQSLRVLKTGLIWISSLPEGADVYLNGRPLDKKTPATIEELMPGKYSLSLLSEGYYAWQGDVDVEQGEVTSVSSAMLFPRIAQFDKLNFEEPAKFFIFNQDKNFIYYLIKASKIIHKVNFDSGELEEVINAETFPGEIEVISLSPDRKKLICYDTHHIALIHLPKERLRKDFLINSKEKIQQIFWHSDSEHFILLTNKDIRFYELFSESRGNVVVISKLSGRNHQVHYDQATDTLIFLNQQEAPDGRRYENIYRIVIGSRFSFPFLRGFKNK